jgi:hypothetical protein
MIYQVWRLSDYTADNLGLAFTGDGLLLGRTPLIERHGARFVSRTVRNCPVSSSTHFPTESRSTG